eukprot:TRINITY_DN792_c0_g1_i11.p2 TRINITY_DN792_c0_g1~~TRINITY_DN792_c0_g1_i11.p2  ORF type:complete len:221 (+),score=21.13 TRINITY_DN792_c0_g1_i11:315-977(+)
MCHLSSSDIDFCTGYRGSGSGTDRVKTPSSGTSVKNFDTSAKLLYNKLTGSGGKFASSSDACKETVKAFTCIKFLWPCLASGTFLREDNLCTSQLSLLTTHCGADTTLTDLEYRSTQTNDFVDGASMCPLGSWTPPSAPASSTPATPTATPTATATATASATATATATPSVPASSSGSPSGSASPSPTQNSINGATASVVTTLSVFVMGILGLCTAVLSM